MPNFLIDEAAIDGFLLALRASGRAAITHDHPSGYHAARFLACIIAAIIDGESLEEAICSPIDELRRYPNHEECLRAVEKALHLAQRAPPTPETTWR